MLRRHLCPSLFATKHFVCTLDLRKAFDFVSPGSTLAWHGFPSKLVQAVHALWAVSDASCRGMAKCSRSLSLWKALCRKVTAWRQLL